MTYLIIISAIGSTNKLEVYAKLQRLYCFLQFNRTRCI